MLDLEKNYNIEFWKSSSGIKVYINELVCSFDKFYEDHREACLIIFTKIKKNYPEFVKKYESTPQSEQKKEVIEKFIENHFMLIDEDWDVIITKHGYYKFNLEVPYIKK